MLKHPKSEIWLEWVTVPDELSWVSRFFLKMHFGFCSHCRKNVDEIERQWQHYQIPEIDVTDSILKVFNRLQKDETLILKGWKLNRPSRGSSFSLSMRSAWIPSLGLASLAAFGTFYFFQTPKTQTGQGRLAHSPNAPLAQIRYENRKKIRVQYVQPELIQTVEFDTTKER